ncbi:MAG: hypothetical protein ACOYXW_01830 [Actinomycetota bacterium]
MAGTVRAKALTRRRLGAAGARALARCTSVSEAARMLATTPYGHDSPAEPSLAALQHAAGATLLWHLRVVAGWLPRDGADAVRLLVAGFEVANLDEHVARLRGLPAEPAYRLGTMETAWSRLRETASLDDVREVLGTSRWGDPGSSSPWAIGVAVRVAWADRVAAGVAEAAQWARAATALLLVREVTLAGRRLDKTLTQRATPVLGADFVAALSPAAEIPALVERLPSDTRWVLDGVAGPRDLWRAEASLCRRVEDDGFRLLHRSGFGRAAVVGVAAVLAVDAWRVRAALESAARGGSGTALEAFDAVA